MLFKLILLVMIFLIITLSICIFSKKDNEEDNFAILIGNPLESKLTIDYDDTFTSEFMSSSYLLKMFENDASKSVDGKVIKLTSLVKKANVIILNIGSFEIYSVIDVYANSYDDEILNRTIDIYLNHLNMIIDNIKEINSNLYVCNIKYPLSSYNKDLSIIFKNLNESINQILKSKSVKLIT